MLDRSTIMPDDFSSKTEADYFSTLQSNEVGRVLTNLSEFLLETKGMQGSSKVKLIINYKKTN